MKKIEQLALIFLFAGVGAQAGYPVFGWIQFVMIVVVILGITWIRHKQILVSLAEAAIVLASAIASVLITLNVADMETGVSLRLVSLFGISVIAWLALPNNIKEHWLLFK